MTSEEKHSHSRPGDHSTHTVALAYGRTTTIQKPELLLCSNSPLLSSGIKHQRGSVLIVTIFLSILLSVVALQSVQVVNTELNILTGTKDQVASFYASENYALDAESFIEEKQFLQTSDELHEYDYWDTDNDQEPDMDLKAINWDTLATTKINDFDGTSAYVIRYLGGRTLPGEGMNDRSKRIYGSVMDYFIVHSFSKGTLETVSRVDTVYSRYR